MYNFQNVMKLQKYVHYYYYYYYYGLYYYY
jgi:hypothetical protein